MSKEDPEDLLLNRLILKEKKIDELNLLVDTYKAAFKVAETVIEKIIDSLPEPIVFRDVADSIKDNDMYKEYINECANLFEMYKINYSLIKGGLEK